jgi:hypothetical protein
MKKVAILVPFAVALLIAGQAYADCWIKVCVMDSVGAGCDDPTWWTGLQVHVVCNSPEQPDYGPLDAQCDSLLIAMDTCWPDYGLKIWADNPICGPSRLTTYEYVTRAELESCGGGTIEKHICLLPGAAPCN